MTFLFITNQTIEVNTSNGDTLTYTYDGSLPLSEVWKGNVNGKVGLTYNNDFIIAQQTINNANPISFTYDKDGLMTSAGSLTMNYSSATGQLVSDTLGNVISTYEYNDFGELKKYSLKYNSNIVFETQYERDALGRIIQLTEINDTATSSYNYTYDVAGRLTEVKKDSVTISKYIYDSNGNRLQRIIGTDTTFATYDEQDRLLQYGNEYYLYNKNGYLTAKITGNDTTKYTYDNLGNLLLVILPNGTNIEYVVDGQNRRIAKKVNGNVVIKYLYQDQLKPVAELDSSGNVKRRYIYGAKQNVPEYYEQDGLRYRIITDHLGSVRLIVNESTGELVTKIDYDEYGKENVVLRDTSLSSMFFGYAGGLGDIETGLTRFGARDYNPNVGRWAAKDIILFEGKDLNLYGYVVGDPINATDAKGLSFAFSDMFYNTQAMIITGAAIGAGYGFGATLIGDAFSGKLSSTGTYVGNTIGGVVAGATKNVWLAALWNSGLALLSKEVIDGGVSGDDIINSTISFGIGGGTGKIAEKLIPRGPGANPKSISTAIFGTVGVNTFWRQGGMQTMLEIAMERFKIILTGSSE